MSRIEMKGGITAEPYPASVGDRVHIRYSGLLSQAGADRIFMHMGYGDQWADIKDYEMTHTDQGWETDVKVHRGGRMYFCFKDRANNWDNNQGHNWSCQVDANSFK